MKKMLRRWFFVDAPAQGALFGLTVFPVGTFLLISLDILLLIIFRWNENIVMDFRTPVFWVLIALLLYVLILTVRFYHLELKKRYRSRLMRNAALWLTGIWVGTEVFAFRQDSLPAIVYLIPLFFQILIPALALRGADRKTALAFTAGVAGNGIALFILPGALLHIPVWSFCLHSGIRYYAPEAAFRTIPNLLQLSETGWTITLAVGMLFLMVGYLGYARFFSGLAHIRFRTIFGRATASLLIAGGIIYAASLAAMGYVEYRCAEILAKFQSQLDQKQPDQADAAAADWFRRQAGAIFQRLQAKLPLHYTMDARDTVLTPEQQNLLEKQFDAQSADWQQLLALADAPPPQQELNPDPQLSFEEQWKYSRKISENLQLGSWYIRLALEKRDFASAYRMFGCLRRLPVGPGQSARFLLNAWSYQQQSLRNMGQQLLESGLGDERFLDRLKQESNDLLSSEDAIKEAFRRQESLELINAVDIEDNAIVNPAHMTAPFRPLSPKSWRYLSPMYRIYQLKQRFEAIEILNAPGFPDEAIPLRQLYFPGGLYDRRFFPQLTAGFRAMSTLIEAAKHRRQYGRFPENPPELPLDPFSGKPLHWQLGMVPTFEGKVDLGKPNDREFFANVWCTTQRIDIQALQIWSVGPNGKDENGLGDDIRVILRLEK